MDWLNRQVDIASLVFFRIVFGGLAVAEMIAQLTYKHWYKGFYDIDAFRFHYIGFEFINPFPEPLMSIFLIAMVGFGFAILVGYRYRLMTSLFAIGYIYTYLLEKGLYLNHGYLFCWLAVVMIFLPAHLNFSLDVKKSPSIRKERIRYWPIAMLCFLMSIVYFFGGIAKINPDWIRGVPLITWVGNKSDMPLLGWLWAIPATGLFMSYAGLFLDLLSPFFLIWKKSRPVVFVALILFHLTNALIFKIGIFPWLSLGLTSLFFSPSWPRNLWNYLINKHPSANAINAWFLQFFPKSSSNESTAKIGKLGLLTIALTALIHISLPLRHHFFEGNVAWTEEGHRYSWRMMLRSKNGYGTFTVKEKGTDRIVKEKPKNWMDKKMTRKLFTHPDMIWQFSNHLADHYKKEGWNAPEVYADIRAQLNDGKYQQYTDKTIDLAAEKWKFMKHKNWIIPMKSKELKSD